MKRYSPNKPYEHIPDSELELHDLEYEWDLEYKAIVQEELILIRKNRKKIICHANLVYKQKLQDKTARYVKHALDYKRLEKLCDDYRWWYEKTSWIIKSFIEMNWHQTPGQWSRDKDALSSSS